MFTGFSFDIKFPCNSNDYYLLSTGQCLCLCNPNTPLLRCYNITFPPKAPMPHLTQSFPCPLATSVLLYRLVWLFRTSYKWNYIVYFFGKRLILLSTVFVTHSLLCELVYFFSLPASIPVYDEATFCLDPFSYWWITVSSVGLLPIKLLWTRTSLLGRMFSFLLGLELLGHSVGICLVL